MNIPGRTVDQLINASLMRQEAGRLSLAATDAGVRDSIATTPAARSAAPSIATPVEVLPRSGASLTRPNTKNRA
jgi:hypothetical protein